MERNIEIAFHLCLCFVHVNYNVVYKASNISIYGPAWIIVLDTCMDIIDKVFLLQILHFLSNEGPKTKDPRKYICYIYNWVFIENATVRASVVIPEFKTFKC